MLRVSATTNHPWADLTREPQSALFCYATNPACDTRALKKLSGHPFFLQNPLQPLHFFIC